MTLCAMFVHYVNFVYKMTMFSFVLHSIYVYCMYVLSFVFSLCVLHSVELDLCRCEPACLVGTAAVARGRWSNGGG